MNIGIFYYSATGTTEQFAHTIADALIKEKNHVELVKIETNVKVTEPHQQFEILNHADCSKYDIILFGGPVWAFSACPVVICYIERSKGLSNKKIMPFATMGFPFRFLGGNRALKQMGKVIKRMNGNLLHGVTVQKLFHNLEEAMRKSATKVVSIINNT